MSPSASLLPTTTGVCRSWRSSPATTWRAPTICVAPTTTRKLFSYDTGFFHPKNKKGRFIEPFNYELSGGLGARDYYDENNA